ncbi:MAG: hypothetical protein JNK67_24080 [Alphaproteobacteria bacterium]|nr:hypothetical protein [Alphaproteobacteria bacterium]
MAKVTFFDLLGVGDALAAAELWPRDRIGNVVGDTATNSPGHYVELMLFLQESLSITGLRSGSDGERSGFWGELHVEPSILAPDRPLVARNLPDFAFTLEPTGPLPATVFVARGATTEIVVHGLPIRLHFPLGFLEPMRTEAELAMTAPLPPKRLTDSFDPGTPDSLEITLSDADRSFIKVRVNVRLSEAGDLYLDMVVPVSIGPCYLTGLPCRAVHDMQLLPSPNLLDTPGEIPFEWMRHSLGPVPLGVVTFRTIELDPEHPTMERLAAKIRDGRAEAAAVEFVIEDLALAQPLPLHGRFALRRSIVAKSDPEAEIFDLRSAPARIAIGPWHLHIFRLLLQTVPLDGTELPVAFDVALTAKDALPGGGSALAVSADEKGVITGSFVFPESERRRVMTLAGAEVRLAALRIGVAALGLGKSPTRPGLAVPLPSPEWAKPLIAVADFSITTGARDKLIEAKARAEPAKPKILHDVGWSLGKLSLGGLANIDIDFTIAKAFRVRIEELGVVTDADGGDYLMLSGSVGTPFELTQQPEAELAPPAAASGENDAKRFGIGIRVHRLRFGIGSGDEIESRFKLDGLSLWLRTKRFELLGFGMASEYTLDPPGNRHQELGFELKLRFEALATRFEFGAQLFHGRVSGADDFTYWMFGFLLGVLPLGSMELQRLRVLAVKNMTPRLDPPGDSTAEEMRLLRWFKREGDALTLRLDRKLAAWMPLDASVAGGVGAGITLAGTKAVRVELFAFAFDSPTDAGVLIGLELYLAKSKDPVAFAALEWDPDTDKWGLAIGLALSLDKLLGDDAPKWITRHGINAALTGLFYAGNQPDTLAIGQYNDVATWLALRFQIRIAGVLDVSVLAAFCRHRVDRPEGPSVTGILVQAKGQLNLGVGKLQFYATFSWLGGQWRNEAISAGDVFLIEAGIRIRLFRVFNFGATIHVEVSQLGPQADATYNRKSFKLSIETPWYLPDVTIRWEVTDGTPLLDAQEVVSPPMTGASAIGPGAPRAAPIGHTPVTEGEAPERVYAMRDLRAIAPIAPGDAAFAALAPIGVDSTIVLDWKPALDAEATVLPAAPPDAGTQNSSDLAARYVLAAIGIRRRARFGPEAGAWKVLLDPAATVPPALDGLPPLATLVDALAPSVGFDWDADLHREGALDPRRLLVNARTPYSFTVGSAASDELIADAHPRWPCCERFPKPTDWHRVDWSDTPLGTRAPASERFTDSASVFQWLTPRAPVVVATTNEEHAARLRVGELPAGLLARARFDARVFACEIFIRWERAHSSVPLTIEAYDGLTPVETRAFPLGAASPPQPIRIEKAGGFTALTLRRGAGSDGPLEAGGSAISVTLVRYRTVEEERDFLIAGARCQAQEDRLAGIRRFAWLPNHDYEITLRTRVELAHAGTGAQATDIVQSAFFRTKGLPGLNAVVHVGEEVEPYVESRYPRTGERLYRREPLAVAFNERFNILAPVERIPVPGSPIEAGQLLEWSLAVEKSAGALGFERVSVTSADWLTTHHGTVGPRGPRDPLVHDVGFMRGTARRAASLDPMRGRFEHMQSRVGGCGHPRIEHASQVLTHEPVDTAAPDAATRRWEADTDYTVNLRRKGGPFVHRDRFVPLDLTAIRPAALGGAAGAWTLDDGALGSNGPELRFARFGEADEPWEHVQLRAQVRPGTGAAGLAVAVRASGASVTGAWVALLSRDGEATTLRLIEIDGGAAHERAVAPLPAAAAEGARLELLAYDDAVVATVGEAQVAAPRGARRVGQSALVVRGDGRVASLDVDPIDGYRLVFRSSRYDDFPAQIAGAGGVVETRAADAFAPPSASVGALLARTRGDIAAAMRPDAPAEARERIFETWTSERALLFRQAPEALSLARLVEGGATAMFALEGPEPLAFSRDVALTIARRTVTGPVLPALGDDRRRPDRAVSPAIAWLASFEAIDDRIIGALPPRALAAVQRVAVIEARRLRLERAEYRIVAHPAGPDGRGFVEAVFDRRRVIPPRGEPGFEAGDVLLLGPDGVVGPPLRPPFPWPPRPAVFVPQPLVILANGDETRALAIPVDGAGNALALPSGLYRFEFAIDRARWRAAAPDAVSNYRARTSFDVTW